LNFSTFATQNTHNMKKVLFLFVLAMTAGICNAQDELPSLVPDRPGMSWGAEVTPHHKIIWDNGFGFEKASDGARTMTLSSTTLRYGLFENTELRVGTQFLMYDDGDAIAPAIGVAPLFIGTKIKLYEGEGILPSVGVLAELRSPHVGSKDLLPSYLTPSMYLLFEHSIGESFWLTYNAGLEWDGETAAPTTFLALALGYSITDNFGAFVESYNYLVREDENQFMTEFGFTLLVSRRVQLDLEGDLDLMNLGKYYAVGCGVSWLIN
jgi:hypothetical protein